MIIAVNIPIKEAWKKSGLQRDSNPWPPQYRCDALPLELLLNLYCLRLLCGFVDSFNFTTTSVVKKHTRQKLCHFSHYAAIAKLFCQKMFRPGHRQAGVFIWKNFHPHYRDLGRKVQDFGNRGSSASHLKKLNFFWRKEWQGEISETVPAQLPGLIWRVFKHLWQQEWQKPWRCNQGSLGIIFLLIFQARRVTHWDDSAWLIH